MKNRVMFILFWGLLCAGRLPADTLEADIAGYLAPLARAETLDEVDAVIAAAEAYLAANRAGSSAVTRGFLQADIVQAHGRACVTLWQRDKTDADLAAKARQLLEASIRQYADYAERADQDADRLAEGLRGAVQRSSRWRDIAGYTSRANYSRAWSYYALGLLDADGSGPNADLSQAMELFEPFIAGGYRDNRIVQDCFLGCGLCLLAQGRLPEAIDLLNADRIRPDNTPPAVFQQITLLRLAVLEAFNSDLEMELAAQLYFQSRPDAGADYDRAELEIALQRIAALGRMAAADGPHAATYGQRLSAFGREAVRYGRRWHTAVAAALDAAGAETALGRLRQAKAAFDAKDWPQALAAVRAGLRIADPALEPAVIADLHYLQCRALYEQGHFGAALAAADAFRQTHPQDRRLAVLSQLALESAIQAVRAGQGVTDAAFDAWAAVYAAHHPAAAADGMLRWYRASFDVAAGRLDAAEARLDDSDPADPAYRRSLYLKCFAAYQQSRRDATDPAALQRAVQAAIDFGAADEPVETWVCVGMLDLVITLMNDSARAAAAIPSPMALIDTAEGLDCLDAQRRGELKAAQLLYLARFGPRDRLRQWLRPTPAEGDAGLSVASLVAAADLLMADAQPADAVLAGEIYAAALDRIEDDEPSHAAVLWKLAESLRLAGRFEPAVDRYRQLLAADAPRVQVRVLVALARTHQALDQHADAARQWRQVIRLTAPYSPGWYEAYYELIAGYRRTGDHDTADQLLAYFALKYPDPLPPAWADRFAALKREAAP